MAMVSLFIEVDTTADLDAEERDEHASDLGRSLRELDGAALSTIASAATPSGGKSAGGALIGGFSLSVAATRESLGAALEAVRAWVAAASSRSAVVELDGDRWEIRSADSERIDGALSAFLDRHAEDAP